MRLVLFLWVATFAMAQTPAVDQLFRAAVEAQQHGDFNTAVEDYQRILQLQPGLFDAEVNLAVALVHLSRFDEALQQYQAALKSQPSNPAVRMNFALAYYKKGDFGNAAEVLTALRKDQPADTRSATLLGDCYLHLAQQDKTIALLTPLIAEHRENPDMKYVLANAHLLAGEALLQAKDYKPALDHLQTAEHLDPTLPTLYRFLGIAKESNGDDKGAETDLRRAVAADPKDFQANLHLGGVLYNRRDLDEARTYIERAHDADPTSEFPVYELALLESAAGNLEAAAANLEKVIQADPNWLEPHVKLAALYYKLHRPDAGMKERQIVDRLTAAQPKP